MNTVVTPSGEEVYVTKIAECFDEYLRSVDIDPDDAEKVTPSLFAGACKYTYLSLFKPDKPQLNNRNTTLDLTDISLLDGVWNVYAQLCYRYGMKPTLKRFSVLTGISQETFATWARKEYRASTGHSESYKKWREECLSALYDSVAQTGNVGGIFLLKADYGFRETAPALPEQAPQEPRESAEEIAARHSGATLPEKPVFD